MFILIKLDSYFLTPSTCMYAHMPHAGQCRWLILHLAHVLWIISMNVRAGVNSNFAIPIPIPAFLDFTIPIPIPELTIPIPIPDLQFQFQFQFRNWSQPWWTYMRVQIWTVQRTHAYTWVYAISKYESTLTGHMTLPLWLPGYRVTVSRWDNSNVHSNKMNYWWKPEGRKEYESRKCSP